MEVTETIEHNKEPSESSEQVEVKSPNNENDSKLEEKSNSSPAQIESSKDNESPEVVARNNSILETMVDDANKSDELSITKNTNTKDDKEETSMSVKENDQVDSRISSVITEDSGFPLQNESTDESDKMDVDDIESKSKQAEESTLAKAESTSMEVDDDEIQESKNDKGISDVLEADKTKSDSVTSTSVLDTTLESMLNESSDLTNEEKGGIESTKENSSSVDESNLTQSTDSSQKESESAIEEPSISSNIDEEKSKTTEFKEKESDKRESRGDPLTPESVICNNVDQESFPDAMESSQDPIETSQDPIESSQDPLGSSQDPIECSQDPIESSQDPIETSHDPIEASQDPIETSHDPIEASQDPLEASPDPLDNSQDPIEASQDPIEASQDLIEASQDPLEASQDQTETSQNQTKSSEDQTGASKDLVENSQDPMKTCQDPMETSDDPIEFPEDPMETSYDSIETSQDAAESSQDAIESFQDGVDSLQNVAKSSEDAPEGSHDAAESSRDAIECSQDTMESSQDVVENSPDAVENSHNVIENLQDMVENSQDGIDILQDSVSENPVFVHVNTETEKGDDKNRIDAQENQDEEDFQSNQPQEDPIASDDFAPVQMEEENDEQGVDEEQGASEELCIIPDTERVLSQEEKDAAATMVPLRDPTDTNNSDSLLKDVTIDEICDSTQGKYVISTCTDENVNTCMQCCLPRKSKYSVANNKKTSFVCDDNCLNSLKDKYGDLVVFNSEGDLRVKNLSSGINSDNMVAKVKFQRKCVECGKKILNDELNLSWETMEYCNELCLSKYQKRIGSNCANCQSEVRSNCLGKYCVRFGYDIRQFCSSLCLEEYKKGLKVCSYCQKDMSGGGDGFLAPVGDKGQFKDFCTQQCMEKYDIMSNNREQPVIKPGSICSVCLNEKPITIEFEHDKKMNLFCGEPCFVAFKFVNNITPGKCDMCKKYFDNKLLEENSLYYDNAQHSFCSKSCQNIYIIAHRRIVPCSWCKVKKYNFDMIKRNFSSGPMLMMCSLNCLSLYQVSLNAVSTKKVNCDHCHENLQPLYHLTMSDATIRNFCSYTCVMAFQSQFPKSPITLNEPEEPVPTGGPKRTKRFITKNSEASVMPADVPTIPIISSVQSLATTNGPTSGSPHVTRVKNGTDSSINMNANSTPPIIKTQIKQHVIIKPTPLPIQRNVATMCKVVTATKATSHRPSVANKEVQTDEIQEKTAIIPVPVPIYVPSPMWMFSMPFPVPFPFPLPVPVPIFIPTTRNSASGIMKEIKKIQVKIPTDPFEAELLMMAEMVAGDKKEENTDSESEEEDTAAPADEGGTFSPEPVDASNTFGDDMLQMALKMATELDEPAVDLEGALTASTITASQGTETTVGTEEAVDDPQPMHHIMERQAVRGRKRPGRPPKNTGSKRGRRASSQMEIPMMAPPQPPPPPEPVEKPDANMCLKYTFGVNAWKQWVTTKNAELEKSSHRVKLFKPEILQLTADELNYSLCLFVKEVRKPNGQEYAPDTIYYLCLGIQQYLFENGRIDNIFCDTYYEKFTDCLDEVAKKFSVLYNDSHYIVTRVEEEHLWESKQLGAHSPHVLLSTLMFFNTKHFNLTTVDEHMQLSFSHIMKHWKRNPNQPGTNKVAGSRNVLLRFYPPQTASDSSTRKKKVYEQQENEENPLRCPVKLYEFYLSKCPESVKTRNDVFYLLPERSCVPDSPVWYSTMPLPRNALEKMLHRVKMVKEINVALLTS